MAEEERRRALAEYAGLTLLYLALSFALLAPLSLDPSRRLPDDGDSLQGLWILWWSGSHVVRDQSELFDGNAYYPHPRGLVYSEPMLAEGLLALPLFELFENRVLAINLFTIATLALSSLGFHLLARELTGSHVGAFLGALLYAFNAYVLSHLAQLQLVSVQWIPLALYCLHRFFVYPRARYALGLVVFTLLVGLSSFYYLAFFSVALAILGPVYLGRHSWRRLLPSVPWLVGFGLAALLLLHRVTAPYREIFDRYGFTGEPAGADLSLFFIPPRGSLLYGDAGAYRLMSYFVGYASLFFAAAGMVFLARKGEPARDRAVPAAYLLLGIVAFVCAGGPDLFVSGRYLGPGLYRILELAGPFEKLREPARFAVLVFLVLGLFVARGTKALLRRFSRTARFLATSGIACLLVAEHWSPVRTRGTEVPTGDAIPRAYPWLASLPEPGPVAELPVRPFREIRRTSMEAYFSTIHERPILFAKPSFYPPAMELLQWELRDFPDERSIALLQAIDVRFALVHPKRWREEERLRRRRLERAPELALVESFPDESRPLWNEYQLGGELLYRVSTPGPAASREPRRCDCIEIDRTAFRVSASGKVEPGLALDGDRGTKWTTSGGQQEGDYFEITFDRPTTPVRVEIEMAFPYGEFPRNLEMNGYLGERGHRVTRIEDIGYTIELVRRLIRDPAGARLRYDLEPMTMDRLRLFIHRTEEATIDWAIPEIHVYEIRE